MRRFPFLLLFLVLLISRTPAVAQTDTSVRLKAEILPTGLIHVTVDGRDRPINRDAYILKTASGRTVPIARVLPRRQNDALLVPESPIDPRRVFYVSLTGTELRALCRRDAWFETLYSDKALGAVIADDSSSTTFRLFAPRADQVRLYLYFKADDPVADAASVITMTRDENGVWESTQAGDYHGVFYDYTIHGPPDPGNHFFETDSTHVTDPYARVSDDSFGKARVWHDGPPPAPVRGGRPAMKDVVAYEVHVQDFTDLLPVDSNLKGTFDAMVLPGLKNNAGESIGFDYLVDLGINVVHLMPVQEYLHYPDDEWSAAFSVDPYMIEQEISNANYQWGYRTTHAFAVESRYARGDSEIGAEREQFKHLIEAFHEKGISVIIDVAANHTGENMDGRSYVFTFNGIDLPYYFRTDESLKHIGPFGNEIKTENRPMVQRWILDQLQHFTDVFGIDGFRIDLAGQIDRQTLEWVTSRLPDDLIIYGEPWIAPSDPDVRADSSWSWYKSNAPITFFQDDARNAFKGPPSNPENKLRDRGYAGGNGDLRQAAMTALLNSYPDESRPDRGINYLDIHDNWALADRFAITDWNGAAGVDQGPFRIAATLLFTSLGPIVMHGGTEMMRSKSQAPLEETVKETASGKIYIHGKRDTYNLRGANHFRWENVGRKPTEENLNDYVSMLAFWKGLIALRRSDAGVAFRRGAPAPAGYYRWILPDDTHLLGYIVDDQIMVLMNTGAQTASFVMDASAAGTWRQVSDGTTIDLDEGLVAREISAGALIPVPNSTAQIWVRN